MLDRTATQSSTVQEMAPLSPHSSHHDPQPVSHASHCPSSPGEEEALKNRKWSEEEHMLYILFLEESREKIKSRLIRRSNAFFKEMAAFVGTKASTQCRSYHQKYETKYKYPHRIIRQEKEKIDQRVFNLIKERNAQKDTVKLESSVQIVKKEAVQTQEFQCQTVIQGISTVLIQQDADVKDYYQQSLLNYSHYSYVPCTINYPILGMHYPSPYYGL